MADARTARPVSGEIMTGRAPQASPGHKTGPVQDIIDADYEVLPSSRARLPVAETAAPSRSTPDLAVPGPVMEGMDMLRRPEGAATPSPASRGGPIFWIAGVGAALAAFWVSGGHALVRQSPLFAGSENAGAAFSVSGVTSRVDASRRTPVLFVDGEAANDGASASPLPLLQIKVTGNDGRITLYTLGTAGRPLAPGERFAFSSRLDVPNNGVRTVAVVFAE